MKYEILGDSPAEIGLIDNVNPQFCVFNPGEEVFIPFLNSKLDLNFDEVHAATKKRHEDRNSKRLFKFGPIAV